MSGGHGEGVGTTLEPVERPPLSGLFLAFEGVEGSGKSTQAQLLADHLRALGREVVHAREPGSTKLGERVRAIVLDAEEIRIPPRSELFLMLAARAAFVEQLVAPALQARQIVIADRFELSTLAYQGAGRGLPIEEVAAANRIATRGVSPDLTILLDLPVDEGRRRQAQAAKRPDRLESEAREFHDRVASGYRDLADRLPKLARVDAVGSVDEVHQRILEVIRARYPETFNRSGFIS